MNHETSKNFGLDKSILLAMPNTNSISNLIIDNLIALGFRVEVLIGEHHFKYPSFKDRLAVKFRRYILGDKQAKQKLIDRIIEQKLLTKIQTLDTVDYVLCIRGDVISIETLKQLKNISRHGVINYQWDGMDRFAEIWKKVPYFDRFFVFDAADLNKAPHFLPATNFYFPAYYQNNAGSEDFDCYFLGYHMMDRQKIIRDFCVYAEQKNWKLDVTIIGSFKAGEKESYVANNIQFGRKVFPFIDNQMRCQNSRVLLDFVIDAHNGLSFRAFEALGYRKKLITTNAEVKKYDFYHENNIFVLTQDNLSQVDEFLTKPYVELPSAIYEKYGFENWVKYILDIPPYIPFNLPEA